MSTIEMKRFERLRRMYFRIIDMHDEFRSHASSPEFVITRITNQYLQLNWFRYFYNTLPEDYDYQAFRYWALDQHTDSNGMINKTADFFTGFAPEKRRNHGK